MVRIADVIVNQTSGNAFMVCQIWQALVETGALDVQEKTLRLTGDGPLGLPQTVRDVLGQRLARLSPGTIDVLQVAALTGIEFELGALREAAELKGQALVDAIDEATQSGILEELPGARLASRFVHELMRRALAELPTAARRADIHRRIGEALERTRTAGRARALADLAHHFTEAAPLIGPEKAISYDLQAADAATASLAYEDAARLLSDAVTLGIDDEIERASVLLATGRARWRAGHLDGSLAAFEDSLELARAIGATEVLAQAAIGHEEACWPGSISDRGAAEFLAEAAGALHPAESPTLVRVLAGLARALAYEGRHDEAVSRQREAVEMARRLGDDQSLAIALLRSYWVRATQPLDEVLQMLTEARDLGEASNDAATHSEALEWRVRVLAELGQLDAAKAEADVMRGVAGATREAVFLHIAELFASALALVDGRLDDAESLAWASREWSHLFSGPDASAQHAIQLFCIRREQDRLGELAPVARVLAADSHAEMWRPGLAVLLAELGMTEEARR
ncbi:MAG: hypothetical protein ACE5EV_09250, partial [Gaiellales bacterium]